MPLFRQGLVWLCCFPSEEEADAYFAETYDEDDEDPPLSRFAADMGQRSYDHDFMERGDYHDPPLTAVEAAVAPHSFSSSYLPEIVKAIRPGSLVPFHCVLLVWGREIENPVSVAEPGRTLRYLGRFPSDPRSGPAA